MHNISKLLAMVLANRLAPRLENLISQSQSTFIKGGSIQDNFQYVQGAINHFHRAKTLMLLLKLDITKGSPAQRLHKHHIFVLVGKSDELKHE
jgi:hypothetical protein